MKVNTLSMLGNGIAKWVLEGDICVFENLKSFVNPVQENVKYSIFRKSIFRCTGGAGVGNFYFPLKLDPKNFEKKKFFFFKKHPINYLISEVNTVQLH